MATEFTESEFTESRDLHDLTTDNAFSSEATCNFVITANLCLAGTVYNELQRSGRGSHRQQKVVAAEIRTTIFAEVKA